MNQIYSTYYSGNNLTLTSNAEAIFKNFQKTITLVFMWVRFLPPSYGTDS